MASSTEGRRREITRPGHFDTESRLSPTTLRRIYLEKALVRYRFIASLQPQEIGCQLRDLGNGTFESLGDDPKFAVDLNRFGGRAACRVRLHGAAGVPRTQFCT